MFDISNWQEIFNSIRSNILRTVLSGFTVALGLYIFIVLFGMGTGLQNAFKQEFAGTSQNLISIITSRTTIAYAGLQQGRDIHLKNKDYKDVTDFKSNNIEYSSPKLSSVMLTKYGNESGTYQITGTNDDEKWIQNRNVIEGRYINSKDILERRYVAVIGQLVQQDLIKKGNPIGKDININGSIFKIIGVFSDESGDWENRMISIPISTLQQIKKSSDSITSIDLTYNPSLTPDEAIEYSNAIKQNLKQKHKVSPDDENAIIVRNMAENLKDTYQFMFVLTFIVGFIGFGTLFAGIIGISNIMIYIVKERTKEIGIRKAIGAHPRNIIGLILQESVFITLISGIVGVLLGILTLKLIGNSLEKYFIKDPSVGAGFIIFAFISLIIAGFIAGFVPAYRASKIKIIDALRAK